MFAFCSVSVDHEENSDEYQSRISVQFSGSFIFYLFIFLFYFIIIIFF